MRKHWKTSVIGVSAMLLASWSFHVHWISEQTIYFNIIYAEMPSIGLFVAGWIGVFAKDHDKQ